MRANKEKSGKKKDKASTQSIVAEQRRHKLLKIACRVEKVYSLLSPKLTPVVWQLFSNAEATIWAACTDYYRRTRTLPPDKQIFEGHLSQYLTDTNRDLSITEGEITEEILQVMYDDSRNIASLDDRRYYEFARSVAAEMLKQYAALKSQQMLFDGVSGAFPTDTNAVLTDIKSLFGAADSLKVSPATDLFGENWESTSNTELIRPIFVAPTNTLMGGQKSGEVYLFAAPYSSCKTTHAIACMVGQARAAREKHRRNPDGKLPCVIMVSYETPPDEMRNRFLSNAAKVPLSRLNTVGPANLSDDPDNPLEYERSLFADLIVANEFVPEKQRVREAIPLISTYMRFLFFGTQSDTAEESHGAGGYPELVASVTDLIERENLDPLEIHIDHIIAFWDNYVAATGTDEKGHDYIRQTAYAIKKEIAQPKSTAVWIYSQLDSNANKAKPTATFTIADVALCKSLGMYVSQGVVAGATDVNNLCKFMLAKKRRTSNKPPCIVHVNGEFNELADVTTSYIVVGSSENFVAVNGDNEDDL